MTSRPPDSSAHAPFRPSAADHDGWFVWRILLALWITLAIAVKVLLLRESTLASFAPPAGGEQALDTYIAVRGLVVLGFICVYLYSYLRDWHFRVVAWVFVVLPIGGLVLDWFQAWSFIVPAARQQVPEQIGLRLVVIGCLLLNALNAHRAPPMPRSIWR